MCIGIRIYRTYHGLRKEEIPLRAKIVVSLPCRKSTFRLANLPSLRGRARTMLSAPPRRKLMHCKTSIDVWCTAGGLHARCATAFTPEEKYPIPSYAASLSQLPEFRRGNKNKTEIVTGAWLSVGLHFPQKHYIIILNLFFCGRVFPEQSVVRSTSSRMMHTRYLNGLAD